MGSFCVCCLLLLMSAPSGRALFCSPLFTQRLEQCPAQNFFFNEKRTVASRESALIGALGPRSLPQPSHGFPAPIGYTGQPLPKPARPQLLPLSVPLSWLRASQGTCSSLHQEYPPCTAPWPAQRLFPWGSLPPAPRPDLISLLSCPSNSPPPLALKARAPASLCQPGRGRRRER